MRQIIFYSFLFVSVLIQVGCANSQITPASQRFPNNDGNLPHSKDLLSYSAVALSWKETQFCSGLQISPTKVVTAAQCFEKVRKEKLKTIHRHLAFEIKGSAIDRENKYQIYFPTPFQFQNSNAKVGADIAVIEFSTALPFEQDILLEPLTEFKAGDIFFTAGFGAHPSANVSPDSHGGKAGLLRTTKLTPVETTDHTSDVLQFKNEGNNQGMVCATDAGSPLILDRDGKLYFIGVLSARQFEESLQAQEFKKSAVAHKDWTDAYVDSRNCSFEIGRSLWTKTQKYLPFLQTPVGIASEFKGAATKFRQAQSQGD